MREPRPGKFQSVAAEREFSLRQRDYLGFRHELVNTSDFDAEALPRDRAIEIVD